MQDPVSPNSDVSEIYPADIGGAIARLSFDGSDEAVALQQLGSLMDIVELFVSTGMGESPEKLVAESSCQASLALEYICDYPYQKDQGLVTSGKSESSEAAFLERIIRTLKRAAEGETRPYDDCTEIHAQLFEGRTTLLRRLKAEGRIHSAQAQGRRVRELASRVTEILKIPNGKDEKKISPEYVEILCSWLHGLLLESDHVKITETYDSAYRRGKSAANPPYICDPRLSHSAQVSTGIQAVEAAFAKGDMDVLLERFKKKLLFTDFLFQPIDEHCYFDIPDNTQKLPDISTGRMLLNFLETKKAALRDKRVHPSIGEKTTSAFSEFVNVLGKIIERSWIKHLLKHQKIKWIPEEKWNRVTSSD